MSPVTRISRPPTPVNPTQNRGSSRRPAPEELWREDQQSAGVDGPTHLSLPPSASTSPPPPYFSGRIDDTEYTSITLHSPTSPPPAYDPGDQLAQVVGPASRLAAPRPLRPQGGRRPSNRALRRAQRRSERRSQRRARCTAGGFLQDPVSLPQTPLTAPWCEWGGPIALLPTYSESELDQPPPYTSPQPNSALQATPYPQSPAPRAQPVSITISEPEETEWEDQAPAHFERRPRISSRELNRMRLRGALGQGAQVYEPSWRGASKVCTHVAIAALMVVLILVLVLFWH
ncbi:membrane protein UL56 [Pteropodid alphaherpesvirus 1]|uniref:Membrane protein UL56 n=1 Tax=Pteropodid alphaherpesvirus 1 TaxID=1343901 RepID=A0A060Q5A6_9ALPH|nr:membrane protein UL56 [Pteropodid alphaherpesvirus 1]BAP00736.1 membrane protein UL56 [Pteropodid alphaherpesvirus 1]